MRRIPMVGLIVGMVMALGAGPAEAAPHPREVTPTECLNAFSDENVDYVGEGWIGNQVSGAPGWWLGSLWDSTDRDFRLYCGDERSGVVHIGHPASTGTVHPITPHDEYFVLCWRATVGNGTAEPAGPGRTRFVYEFRRGEYAIAYVDNVGRFTYTLFTTGAASNNWNPCFTKLM